MKTKRKTDANMHITPVTHEKFNINYLTFPITQFINFECSVSEIVKSFEL
jgi:hypothetical protein